MKNKIIISIIKIVVLFCISFTLVFIFDLLFHISRDTKELFIRVMITAIPFAVTILYSDYKNIWKKNSN
ncbi:unknown [Bacteroides sp. CAG:1076]|jgi:uncharacterized membrane protein YozB (DUF420 family)|nr:unknown [Bacteroides sp. CAG:1076]